MKTKDEDYEPFGEEWKNHLMKLPKIVIINMFRNVCFEKQELEEMYSQAVDTAGAQEQRAREAERECRNFDKRGDW